MKSNRGIRQYLERKFVAFSFLVLLTFLVAYIFVSVMGNYYIVNDAKMYFAESLITEDYEQINTSHIDDVEGWISILDQNLNLVYSSKENEKKQYTINDILKLQNAMYEYNGIKYYGSVKEFKADNGDNRYGLVMIPSKYITVKATLVNMNSPVRPLILIFTGGLTIAIAGFLVAVYGLSRYMKKQLTDPLAQLVQGFSKVSEGLFDEQLSFESVDEFVELRDSFNVMSKRLQNLENEKQEIDEQRQQLFASIGHDLKTPITVICGYTGALVEKRVPDDQIESVNSIINSSANNLAEQVEFLLDYTRLNCSDYTICLAKVNVCELIRQTVISLMAQFEKCNINLEVYMPKNEPYKQLDASIFRRAISNILVNILQHNPENIEAYIEVDETGKIIIADSGTDISDELLAKIYDPFVSGDESRKPGNNNSGLGLSITKKIVEKHGGKITIEKGYKGYTKAFIIEL